MDKYPPISDYGYISDCHSAALVSRSGSVDWCCMPRIDSKSCFGRLLGWDHGGYCMICPASAFTVSRRYLSDSLILETTFASESGRAKLLDCFTMREGGTHHPHNQFLRIVEGISGNVDFRAEIVPRFDYGSIKPWIRRTKHGDYKAIGGSDGLFISGDIALDMKERHDLEGRFTIAQGQRKRLSLVWNLPENLDGTPIKAPSAEELDNRLQQTIDWWNDWTGRYSFNGRWSEYVLRSATVLKGLTNAPTGAIAAAATTSLPEAPKSSRNWDYRFSWIRDSSFVVRSLFELGYIKEADGFRRFIERCAAGSADQLQILFGVGGERRLHEFEIEGLEGYDGDSPVRAGNAAESQLQLDMYGELLDLAWQWHVHGRSPDDDYWNFLESLINRTAAQWTQPDKGIWEMRGSPRHFVQSKVMCWAAMDRGIKLARDLKRNAPLDTWSKTRDEIRRAVEEKGYDSGKGVFIQAFDQPKIDAALLLLPLVGFVAYDDERMIRTTDAVRRDLSDNGLIRRYPYGIDEMEGKEGAFLACSFWLAECLAGQGRVHETCEVFEAALATANDLLLFSEEYDVQARQMLGNFPQGLTHLSLISAAVAVQQNEKANAAVASQPG
jgi:GH15 family glucan-1,4-alpha-glucosidase